MLKTALFDCAINEKCCSVDGGRGICPVFSSPPRGIWQLKSPHPREFAIQGKQNANARGGGWAQVTDALQGTPMSRLWEWGCPYYCDIAANFSGSRAPISGSRTSYCF